MWCRISKIAFWLFLLLLAVSACKVEPKIEKKTVARVGDAVLTDYDLELMLGSERFSRKHRMELIKDWVKKEMLFREAQQNKLTDSDDYKLVIENSGKELAAAKQLEYFIDGDDESFSRSELEEFFEQYKSDFRLESDAYLLNIARFYEKNNAINFRGAAIENGWEEAFDEFGRFAESAEENEFLFDYELEPVQLLRITESLFVNELSIVVEIGPRLFGVVQLKQTFKKGEIPEFEFVEKTAEARFKVKRRRDLLNEYIAKLYSKYDVVINGEN